MSRFIRPSVFVAVSSFLVTSLVCPTSAWAGWIPAVSGPEPETTYAPMPIEQHRQLSRQYSSRDLGISGVFWADVYTNGTAFEIEMVDFANHADDCEIHVFGDEDYFEQWNTETCDPNRVFQVLALAFHDEIEDSILGDWWAANGSAFTPGGGGGGDSTPGIDPSHGREDSGDSDTADCMKSVALNCGLTFVGGVAAVLTAGAVLTPAGGAAVAVVAGAAVGVACGAAIYSDCMNHLVQMMVDLIEVETVVEGGLDLVVDMNQILDYVGSIVGSGVTVEAFEPTDLVGAGSGFAVTFEQPDAIEGTRTLGGVPLSLVQ